MLLEAALLNARHEGRHRGVCRLDSVSRRLAHVLAETAGRCTLSDMRVLVARVNVRGQAGDCVVLLNLGRADAVEEFLIGRVLAQWLRVASVLARHARDWLDHVRGDDFFKCRGLGRVALGTAKFICRLLDIGATSLRRVDALVRTSLLLAVDLLLLGRRGRNVEVRAQALLLAAALSVNTVRARVTMVSHRLLILGSASVRGRLFGNLSSIKNTKVSKNFM